MRLVFLSSTVCVTIIGILADAHPKRRAAIDQVQSPVVTPLNPTAVREVDKTDTDKTSISTLST